MPALNIDLDYFEHPKVMSLVAELGNWAEILPIRLWRFTARYHPETGVISARSMKLLEVHLNWHGKKGKAIELLVSVGFLEPVGDGNYNVHDFLDHQGHIESFSIRGKAGAKARWAKAKQSASSMLEALQSDATSNALPGGTNGLTDGADGKPNPSASPRKKTKREAFLEAELEKQERTRS